MMCGVLQLIDIIEQFTITEIACFSKNILRSVKCVIHCTFLDKTAILDV
jgi:hypothetical protein